MLLKHINSILYIKPILKRKLDKIDVIYLPLLAWGEMFSTWTLPLEILTDRTWRSVSFYLSWNTLTIFMIYITIDLPQAEVTIVDFSYSV